MPYLRFLVSLCVTVFLFTACLEPPPKEMPVDVVFEDVQLPVGDPDPRGVVLITVDTLRADQLGTYGHEHVLTPNFDRLASGGQLFRQAIAQSSTTTPSHASLMTGLYLHDHNAYSNFEAIGDGPVTLAESLKEAGFSTFATVNMRHLNPEVSNLGQGITDFVRSANMRRAADTVEEFLTWLDSRKEGERFFAWLHLTDVHTPYRPPPPYDRLYYDDDERDPRNRSLTKVWPLMPQHLSDHPFFRTWLAGITDLKWVLAQYQGAVSYVDSQVGRLLDSLEDRRLLNKTAVVVTADHGESLGEHDMYFVHTGLYDATIHVPLITYFPGSQRQGVEVHETVELVDVMPTVLDYLDVPVPENIRGQSRWPLIRGEVVEERIALSEHAGRNQVALRSSRFKYIRHLRTRHLQPAYRFVRNREELYDIQADPLEKQDIATQYPEVLRQFRHELRARRESRFNLSSGRAKLNQETIAVLRALGYVR